MDDVRGTITAPFTVVADTREQLSYQFANIRGDAKQKRRRVVVPVVRGTVPSGDYSILGFESTVACERKSIHDLFGTISQGRDRFKRELARLNELDFAAVVVEAEWSQILRVPCPNPQCGDKYLPKPPRSQLPPKNVFRSVLAWQQEFQRVHWLTCINREHAEVVTYRVLEKWWSNRQRKLAKVITDKQQAISANGVVHA